MVLTELENRSFFVGMMVGRQGCGKSGAIASFAEEGPVEIIDMDRRARGILGCRSFLGDEALKKININQSITPANGFAALKKQLEIYVAYQNQNKLPFRTLVMESAGTLGKILVLESKKLRGVKSTGLHKLGEFTFSDPSDYNYCSQAFVELLYNYIMPLQCNFILSAWVVDRWAKKEGNEYGESEVVGKKLNTTDKWAEEVPGYFDEVYYFEKMDGSLGTNYVPTYTVQFETDLAKTSFEALKNQGKVNITNKNFYKTYKALLEAKKNAQSNPQASDIFARTTTPPKSV